MLDIQEKRTAPPALVSYAKGQIQDILMSVSGVDFIMICSTDGFELASVSKKNHYNSSKLAAVSSSIHAMVNAFLGEIHLTGVQSITLDADNGKAIITSVPGERHPMVIVVLAAKDILIGQLLHGLKAASQNIEKREMIF